MDKLSQTLTSAQEHLYRNRGRYLFAVGLAAGLAINHRAVKEWNAFLIEKGLLDEFYTPEF